MDKNKNIVNDIFKLSFLLNHNLINYNNIIKKQELPPSHIKVLYYLRYNKDSIITDLALVLGISKSNMTPIIDKLTEMNFIKKEEYLKDKRKIYIALTEGGIAYLKKMDKKIMKNIENKLDNMTDEDLENIRNLVLELNKYMCKI